MPSTIGITANQLIWKFTPRQLDGLVNWWDAYTGEYFTYWTGVLIEQWKGVTGFDLVTSLFQSQAPAYNGSVDGHTAINFDGVSDYFYGGYSSATNGEEMTVIMVCDPTLVDGSMISFQGGDPDTYFGIFGAGPGVLAAGAAIAGRRKTNSGTQSTTAISQTSTVGTRGLSYDGSEVILYINDSVKNTVASSGATTFTEMTIGMSGFGPASPGKTQPETFFDGSIGEICIYNRKLTATEYTQVHDYLYYKWITY